MTRDEKVNYLVKIYKAEGMDEAVVRRDLESKTDGELEDLYLDAYQK